MAAGVRTPAEVQRVLGIEPTALAMDVIYQQMERGLLDTDGGQLNLTALGQTALSVGRAPTRVIETIKLLVDPSGCVLDATRVRHSARRRGDLQHEPEPRVSVDMLQAFVTAQPEWREKDAVVTDADGEKFEQLVVHTAHAQLDLDSRVWCNVILDRSGQPSAGLQSLVSQVNWVEEMKLGPPPTGQPVLWDVYAEGALLETDARRAARNLVEGAQHLVQVSGWDLTGQGTHPYAHALTRVPGLRVSAELAEVTADWDKLAAQFGARVTVRTVPSQVASLVVDDQTLRATPAWVPMQERGTQGRTVTLAQHTSSVIPT